MIDRTGILPNSPLIYSLASVRFTPWAMMSKYIDEIHEELRGILPIVQKIQLLSVGINGQPQTDAPATTIWMFLSGDRSTGMQFSSEQILVFSKRYTQYSEFSKLIEKALDAIFKRMGFLHAVSLGVRYIDHIKVRSNENVGLYLESGLLPVEFTGLQTIGGVSLSTYKTYDVELRVRCTTQPGIPVLPDELLALISMIQPPGRPFEVQGLEDGEIILDMDSITQYQLPERMDSSSGILTKLNELHIVANAFFRRKDVFTDFAFEVWKGKS